MADDEEVLVDDIIKQLPTLEEYRNDVSGLVAWLRRALDLVGDPYGDAAADDLTNDLATSDAAAMEILEEGLAMLRNIAAGLAEYLDTTVDVFRATESRTDGIAQNARGR